MFQPKLDNLTQKLNSFIFPFVYLLNNYFPKFGSLTTIHFPKIDSHTKTKDLIVKNCFSPISAKPNVNGMEKFIYILHMETSYITCTSCDIVV